MNKVHDKSKVTLTSSRMVIGHVLSEYIIGMAFLHLKGFRSIIERNNLKNIDTVTMKVNWNFLEKGNNNFFRGFLVQDFYFLDTVMLYWTLLRKCRQVCILTNISLIFLNKAFDCKVTVLDNISDPNVIKELEQNGITIER